MNRLLQVCNQGLAFSILAFAALITAMTAQPTRSNLFLETVRTRSVKPPSCKTITCICSITDESIALRLLAEYGSIFASAGTVFVPSRCIFENEKQVTEFQSATNSKAEIMSGVTIELQSEALTALLAAQADAAKTGFRISPLDGSIAAKRSYSDTIRIWNSRYLKALDYWVKRGKITAEDADTARNDAVLIQIRKVIGWESSGYNFGTNMKGSIFSSTAPPGTSQHLSLLAFDVAEYANPNVRKLLNRYGWYQTIVTDNTHFTFLGLPESRLANRGLKAVWAAGHKFWVPDIPAPALSRSGT